ncbi:MAG: 2-C-methyl-D-erythritol 2,4-cyclodiphosphate synthase [Victivallaceae bacterium]|nr:2-C-methyl-D-erythritol 2,4-cyclodiphosphate synthase [Victivallaceae bacterium]MDD4180266.1 2-C-methyl-D-erythritol 2,4-cyclodiphosphate synthase [Victivallaceae bacterium]
MFRIGQGFDVHRLVKDRNLILCGVTIPHSLGLAGHSDADVAVHALIDAYLGALALGDIGSWFPDNDPKYKNADSMKLLETVINDQNIAKYQLVNLDLTIVMQEPKIAPYIDRMRTNLISVLDCSPDRISIKATTTERLGYCGRGEGIAANAILLLEG